MGKPIAGQDQFPFTLGGYLVDGVNIKGTTICKSSCLLIRGNKIWKL